MNPYSSSFLLAFGFGNLAMLGWLAAAAAPLLIHLWSRHRFREAPWAAMQFLLAAMRKNARRMQLQQWLLLAVRTLIITLVVLAVAEPYGERLLAGGSGTPKHTVIVLDASYSMACHDQGASRFQRAKQLASALVRDSQSADSFTVVLMAAPAKVVIGREVVDHATVAAKIEALSQPHTGADLPGALNLINEALADESPTSKSERKEVCFVTDLQRATWGALADSQNDGSATPLRERIAAIAKTAVVSVIDLGEARTKNLAVTRVNSPDAFVTVGREISFDVVLHQFGQEPRPNCAVEFLVDDVPVGEQTVDVPAGSDATLRFTHRFQLAGEHTVTVRAPGDELGVDNLRSLVVRAREEIRVLCVAGREGAAKYVAEALNPNPVGGSPIRPIIVSEADLPDVELTDFDCIFFCNVAQFTPDEADRIARYAASGGGVVFFLGDHVVRESYNALASGDRPLLPARLGDILASEQPGIDPLEYRHPIVAPFRGRERAGLLTTPITRYFRLDVPEKRPGLEIAAAMLSGDPFIVAQKLARGRVVLVATDGSLASVDAATGEPWTNWPTWPSFLPIVRELLAYASGGHHHQWQQLVGIILTGREPVGVDDSSGGLKLTRPDGRTASVSLQTSPSGREWSYSDTDVSGIYVLQGLPSGESQRFTVNVDTAESDLAKTDLQDLPPELHHRKAQRLADDSSHTTLTQSGWNVSILWAALLLMFVETFLAWQFGRGAP